MVTGRREIERREGQRIGLHCCRMHQCNTGTDLVVDKACAAQGQQASQVLEPTDMSALQRELRDGGEVRGGGGAAA